MCRPCRCIHTVPSHSLNHISRASHAVVVACNSLHWVNDLEVCLLSSFYSACMCSNCNSDTEEVPWERKTHVHNVNPATTADMLTSMFYAEGICRVQKSAAAGWDAFGKHVGRRHTQGAPQCMPPGRGREGGWLLSKDLTSYSCAWRKAYVH
jgi:hypothetical protein